MITAVLNHIRRLARWAALVWMWGWRVLLILALLFALPGPDVPDTSRKGRIKAQLDGYTFNYLAWEVEALWHKFQQIAFGYTPYLDEATSKAVVLDYLQTVGRLQAVEADLAALYTSPAPAATLHQQQATLQAERDALWQAVQTLQPLAEPIIEAHVNVILREQGFDIGGQVMPPVQFRFVESPDVLIVSPRDTIRQDFDFSLQPLTIEERVQLEARVEAASSQDAAYIVGVGGVGIYPAIVAYTRWAAFAYEIVAHEWAHHYLFLYPSGQQYLVAPESRIINETAATIFGNAVGLLVLERFWGAEVAQGLVFVPDYPTLADFFPAGPEAALFPDAPTRLPRLTPDNADRWQTRARTTADFLRHIGRPAAAVEALATWRQVLETHGISLLATPRAALPERTALVNRTRITTDYLLDIGRIEAAEAYMTTQGQQLGIRGLNQAWFAFYGGYQADPGAGGGQSLSGITDVLDPRYPGDPIGPAVQEIFERSASPYEFLVQMRDITTRAALLDRLRQLREGDA